MQKNNNNKNNCSNYDNNNNNYDNCNINYAINIRAGETSMFI